jgi:hypothetical protein
MCGYRGSVQAKSTLGELGNAVAKHPGKVPHSKIGKWCGLSSGWKSQPLAAKEEPQPILWGQPRNQASQGWCPGRATTPGLARLVILLPGANLAEASPHIGIRSQKSDLPRRELQRAGQ